MASNGSPQSDMVGLSNSLLQIARKNQVIETFKYNAYEGVQWVNSIATPWMGGESITWAVRHGTNGSARSVGFNATDTVNIVDNTTKMAAFMKFKDANWGFDKKEAEMNRGSIVYRLIPERRSEAFEDIANKTEEDVVLGPSSSSDTLCNFGLANWLCPGPAGSYTDGWQGYRARYRTQTSGGGATGYFDTIAGQDRSTAAAGRLKNWAGITDGKINEPFLKQVQRAMERTRFKPPPVGSYGIKPDDSPFFFWLNLEDYLNLRPFIDSKNSNFGKDVTSVNGQMYIFNMPVSRIPVLDPDDSGSDTDFYRTIAKPMYGVRRKGFEWMHMPNRWFTETDFRQNPNNHDGVLSFIDSSGQLCPLDLRTAGFCLHRELAAST